MNKPVRIQLADLADYCRLHDIPDDAKIVGEPGDLHLIVPTNGKVTDVAEIELPTWHVDELPVEVV